MEEKILYYLGAGASVNALPLAKTIFPHDNNRRIEGLAYAMPVLSENISFMKGDVSNATEYITEIKNNFTELADKADAFGDVDTYAKYLYLIDPDSPEFKKVKSTLSIFFSIKQTHSKALDRRYLPWLVSIMDKKTFPNNIKILSWNYDFQVEIAAANFGEQEDITYVNNGYSYKPSSFCYYPNLERGNQDLNPSLIHLNGIAGFAETPNSQSCSIYQRDRTTNVNELFLFLKENKLDSKIHFAWENKGYHSDLMNNVNRMIDQTSILVIVGYSFPFFNREYDKKIFSFLTKTGYLRKIYYQDPALNGEQLRAQFGLASTIEIVHIPNTENFHVPFEY